MRWGYLGLLIGGAVSGKLVGRRVEREEALGERGGRGVSREREAREREPGSRMCTHHAVLNFIQ